VSDEPIRIFVVDDHELIRRGLRDLISIEDDLELAGEADRIAGALELIIETRPDVCVLDVRLPDGNGVELCREILSAEPAIRCVMFTSFADKTSLLDAVMAGAAGFLLKSTDGADLIAGIRAAGRGQSLLDPTLTRDLIEGFHASASGDAPMRRLTQKERQVLDLVGEGLTNRQIAERLGLAEKTIKNHISHLLQKLEMEHRTQAALYVSRRHDDEQG